jgi:hypothetical protein
MHDTQENTVLYVTFLPQNNRVSVIGVKDALLCVVTLSLKLFTLLSLITLSCCNGFRWKHTAHYKGHHNVCTCVTLPTDRWLIEARNANRNSFVYTADIEAQCDRFSGIS